jgi:O-antigen/teichoic acid export membrane protein
MLATLTRIVDRARDISRDIEQTVHHPLVGDAGLLAVSQYTATGLSLMTTVIVARLLGPMEYGVVAMIMAYPTFLWTVAALKPVSVITRYISSFRETGQNTEIKAVCKLGYSLDFLASLVALALAGASGWWVMRHFLNMPEMVWLMMIYAASFPLSSLAGTSIAILTSWQYFRWLAGLQVLDKIITLILVVGCVLAGLGVPGVVLGTALGQAINGAMLMAVATFILYQDGIGLWWSSTINKGSPLWKELSAFLGWNYLLVTLSGLVGQVPLILLGRLRGPEEAGFYRLATNLMTAGSLLETSLGRVTYPVLSARWYKGERKSLIRSIKRWTLHGGIPVSALMSLTIPLLPVLVPTVFGLAYRPMVLGAQVMMAGAAISALFFWLSSAYYAFGKIRAWTKAYVIYTALVIGLASLCIQSHGFFGLAGLVAVGKVLFTVSMVVILITDRENC